MKKYELCAHNTFHLDFGICLLPLSAVPEPLARNSRILPTTIMSTALYYLTGALSLVAKDIDLLRIARVSFVCALHTYALLTLGGFFLPLSVFVYNTVQRYLAARTRHTSSLTQPPPRHTSRKSTLEQADRNYFGNVAARCTWPFRSRQLRRHRQTTASSPQ